jgi:iron(II)-dependent oxidoreductase
MILIPAGTFTMGCVPGDAHCKEDERPPHPVMLGAFYMDATEVTVGEYGKCVDAGRCMRPNADGGICNWGRRTERNGHPVNCVDWNMAAAYCEWKGGRLPSEAEWEYAARGGHEGWTYPWGGEPADCGRAVMFCNRNKQAGGWERSTAPVGSKEANGYGLYDMAGNVSEWCSDWFDEDYYSRSPSADPSGAPSGRYRVRRGGSWDDASSFLRISRRHWLPPDQWIPDVGFRCVRSAR